MVKIQIYIKMLVMVLFHHHSSMYIEDWSKVSFSELCSNPRYIYYWHSKFHNKLFSLFSKQHTTSLHIIGIMEKYDHIQTGMEKIFGLYGVVFSGIYDSIQIRYGVVLYSVGLYGGGYFPK